MKVLPTIIAAALGGTLFAVTPKAALGQDTIKIAYTDPLSGPFAQVGDANLKQFQFILEIVTRDKEQKGFVVLPKRWIVERTLAWLGRNRILSKEYEHLTQTSESDVYIAAIRMMLRRLDRSQTVPNF